MSMSIVLRAFPSAAFWLGGGAPKRRWGAVQGGGARARARANTAQVPRENEKKKKKSSTFVAQLTFGVTGSRGLSVLVRVFEMEGGAWLGLEEGG